MCVFVVRVSPRRCVAVTTGGGLTGRPPQRSQPQQCSGTPAGWTRRGSGRTLLPPPGCGTAGGSGTGQEKKRGTQVGRLEIQVLCVSIHTRVFLYSIYLCVCVNSIYSHTCVNSIYSHTCVVPICMCVCVCVREPILHTQMSHFPGKNLSGMRAA